MLKKLGERHDEGVKITLLTLPADGYPKERIEKTKELLTELTEVGVAVMESREYMSILLLLTGRLSGTAV